MRRARKCLAISTDDHRIERSARQLLPRPECLAAQRFGGAGRCIEANVGYRGDVRRFESGEDLKIGLGDPAGANQSKGQ